MNTSPKKPAVQTVLVLLFFFTVIFPFQTEAEPIQPLANAPFDIQEAYNQVSADFVLYQLFLQAEETPLGPILINVHNPDEAHGLLKRGFCDELAGAIYSSYAWYDGEHGCLFLIPCDGIPIMGLVEKSEVKFIREEQDRLSFQYRFENCYQPGDAYIYKVKTRLEEGRWKIEALELIEAL